MAFLRATGASEVGENAQGGNGRDLAAGSAC